MRLLLLMSLGLLLSSGSLKAQTETWYTATVNGLSDQNESSLNELFRSQNGVILFRADHISETIFVTFSNAQLTQEQVIQLLLQEGVSVICYVVQDNGINLRQKLMNKCRKETDTIEPLIEQK